MLDGQREDSTAPSRSQTHAVLSPRPLAASGLRFADRHRGLVWAGVETPLSPTEARILHALFDAGSRVVARAQLAAIANTDARRGLDAHMYRLRHKLNELPGLELETVPKRGFRLSVQPDLTLVHGEDRLKATH